ncbi:hypothetical protein B0G75_112181 [Paraburkholderia sp. BL18I3N2]|uniref:hypothetical protein n=1 Tax=Paraburkholderia sp. BL18I3N2 TaxID=1938799 RepID=UPI000D436275|nr:hypothetical protein B0G75_112181 [Paraburkholderia sp. BL18I3N2]
MEIVQCFGEASGKCMAGSADRIGFEGCYASLGLQYFLSKSTDVSIDLLYRRATNAVAQIEGASGPSSSGTQFIAVTGIRRKF